MPRLLGALHHSRRARFDGGQQGLISKVAVTHGALMIGVPEDLADRVQVDAGVDHEAGGRVPQIVEPGITQARCLPRRLPRMLHRDER